MMHLGWAFLQLSLLAPQALAETSVPLLRGSTRGLAELPSCTGEAQLPFGTRFVVWRAERARGLRQGLGES